MTIPTTNPSLVTVLTHSIKCQHTSSASSTEHTRETKGNFVLFWKWREWKWNKNWNKTSWRLGSSYNCSSTSPFIQGGSNFGTCPYRRNLEMIRIYYLLNLLDALRHFVGNLLFFSAKKPKMMLVHLGSSADRNIKFIKYPVYNRYFFSCKFYSFMDWSPVRLLTLYTNGTLL